MIIYHRFTTLNEYVNAERRNKYLGAKIKRDETNIAYYSLKGTPPIETPCRLHYHWYISSKRLDLDNVGFACKFLNDGLVKAGIIPNDNVNHIIEIRHTYEVSKKLGVKIESY